MSRREFLGGVTLAGTAGFLGLQPRSAAAEPPPETTTLRLRQISGICVAPQYVAEELLHAEGFANVQYVKATGTTAGTTAEELGSGEVDISMGFVPAFIVHLDGGDPLVLLGGVHVGCFELFGTDQVHALRDLKGKTVAVPGLGSPPYVFLASILAYVGLDPRRDVNWVTHSATESMQLFAAAKIDAYLGFPPEPQELRARKIGHVLLNSSVDRPWSQYFCCMVAGNREFVRKHPVASKRAVRAILKAASICALEADRSAQLLVDKGFKTPHEFAFQTMKEVPYGRWREYNPEDTIRFYALRLHEAGMIKSTPQQIIAQGTDWRFLNELKKELKG
jgi:NitT/TauT family transport system substrate-binding protein